MTTPRLTDSVLCDLVLGVDIRLLPGTPPGLLGWAHYDYDVFFLLSPAGLVVLKAFRRELVTYIHAGYGLIRGRASAPHDTLSVRAYRREASIISWQLVTRRDRSPTKSR